MLVNDVDISLSKKNQNFLITLTNWIFFYWLLILFHFALNCFSIQYFKIKWKCCGFDLCSFFFLFKLWENKLTQSRALDSGPEPSESVMIPSTIQYIPQPVQNAPSKQQFSEYTVDRKSFGNLKGNLNPCITDWHICKQNRNQWKLFVDLLKCYLKILTLYFNNL